MPYKQTTVNVG